MLKKGKKTGPKKEMKFTSKTVKKLEAAFAIDASIEEACYYANITRQTFYNWKKAHPELFDSFERLRNKPILKARQAVVNSLDNPEYAFKYLRAKRKNEFSEKSIIGGGIVTGELSEEHKKKIDQILGKIGEDF